MAKISNTTVYPNILPTIDDFVILTDVNDNNETKTSKVSDFQSYFGTRTAQITLTPTQILNITTNPVTLITAPSVTEFIIPISWAWKMVFNTVAYDFSGMGGHLMVTTAGSSGLYVDITQSLINSAASITAAGGAATSSDNSILSEDLILSGNAPPLVAATVGDSDIQLNIQYRIVKF